MMTPQVLFIQALVVERRELDVDWLDFACLCTGSIREHGTSDFSDSIRVVHVAVETLHLPPSTVGTPPFFFPAQIVTFDYIKSRLS